MTLPPCKVNGVECDKRYIGCHASCASYHEWLAIHEKEKAVMQKNKSVYVDARTFEIDRRIRDRQTYHREYMRKRRREQDE